MSGTVLVTGGGGFIGTWVLRELLARGVEPVVFDLRPAPDRWRHVLGAKAAAIPFEAGSLADRGRVLAVSEARQVRRVIHLAALLTPACQQDPWAGCQVNVLGTVTVFEAARALKFDGISYASSFAVYGPEAGDDAADQVHNRPPTFYGAFKEAADLIAEQYWRHFGVTSVGIRPHVVYGPERDEGLTAGPSLAARAAAIGEPYLIGYRARLGYDYVEDVAAAFVRAAFESPPGHHIVDLSGEQATTEEFARAIEAAAPASAGSITVSGPEIPTNVPPERRDISRLFPGWRATSLRDGVLKTVEFYRNRRAAEPEAAPRSAPPVKPPAVPVEALRAFCAEALRHAGLKPSDAATTAEALVSADAMGVFTHGTKLLPGYLNRLRGGGYDPAGVPRVEREGPAWAVVDGASALGQVGGEFSMRLAVDKARAAGCAYVGLRNTGHIGAAGYYATLAARQGLIGIVLGNDVPSVAAPGSRGAVLGSNPLAYAVPFGDADPILLDVATAAVAGGKVYAAIERGESIPPTWLIGTDGLPTTDGRLYPQHAALAPMAGHKGYGLALLAEILAAVLPGGAVTRQVGSWIFDPPDVPSRHNAGFLAIDVAAVAPPADFAKKLQALADEIHAAPTAEGVERVALPGEREWANFRRATAEGVPLPRDVIEKLRGVARTLGDIPDWLI